MNLNELLLKILREAGAIGHARYGSIQCYNTPLDCLELVVSYGYASAPVGPFPFMRLVGPSATVRAFRLGKRVIIPDVRRDPLYGFHLPVAEQLGYRAVQATPLLDPPHKPLGILTTLFAEVYYPTRAETEEWDRYAKQAASLLRNFPVKSGPPY